MQNEPEYVEEMLSRIQRPAAGLSVLESLRASDSALSPAEVAASILDEMADTARGVSTEALLLWRHVQHKKLWTTHPDEKLRTADCFLATLADPFGVRALFEVATSTARECDGYVRFIDKRWGERWLEVLLYHKLLPPQQTKKTITKTMLTEIAGNAKLTWKYPTVEDVVLPYKERIALRTDLESRKKYGITGSKALVLNPQDARALNKAAQLNYNVGRRTHDSLLAEHVTEVPFKVVSGEQALANTQPQRAPEVDGRPTGPSRGPSRARGKKRKAGARESSLEEQTGGDRAAAKRLRVLEDGQKELVRVRNHLLVRPRVPSPPSTPASPSDEPGGRGVREARCPSPASGYASGSGHALRRAGASLSSAASPEGSDSGSRGATAHEAPLYTKPTASPSDSASPSTPPLCAARRLVDEVLTLVDDLDVHEAMCSGCRDSLSALYYATRRAVSSISRRHTSPD